MKNFSIVAASSLLFMFSACSDSSNKSTDMKTDTTMMMENNADGKMDPMVKSADAQLIYELTESMYAGIALMKDGEQKATDPAVKALASKLVTEHSKLTKELEALSAKKNWTLPAGEPDADKMKREMMGKEDVMQYQKDWLAALRERHETNIMKLENATPADPDVKGAGEKGLPKIKELLGEIKAVQAKM